jgi:hypothetical protein
MRRLIPVVFLVVALAATGCDMLDRGAAVPTLPPPTVPAVFATDVPEEPTPASAAPPATAESEGAAGEPSFVVYVDANDAVGEISPLIYGLSSAPPEVLADLRPTLNSWGGNANTRYNWRLGNAWNAASDWFYMNTNYEYDLEARGMPAHESFLQEAAEVGAAVRMAVPTMGWVAKDTDPQSCSFPLPGGECGDGNGASCRSPGEIADPELTSVRSTSRDIQEWVQSMLDGGYTLEFIAMDNEPELWGYTHYDVHPECTTYQEILEKYLEYAAAVREVAPASMLTGPATCCWEYYWHSAAGSRDEAQHDNMPFLAWFLEQVRAHDEANGVRTLDVLDIHFYPEGLYNQEAGEAIAARRLRSTHSLWDREYVDESWINDRIALIPRMQALIDEYYPGTLLGISEWNWGADETMNGALAVADVLGILGREDVYMAAYWRYPSPESPSYQAFKLYTNYDDAGSRFEGTALAAHSADLDRVTAYAALAEDGSALRIVMVNKQPETEMPLRVITENFATAETATLYTLDDSGRHEELVDVAGGRVTLTLPPYSATLLVFESGSETGE